MVQRAMGIDDTDPDYNNASGAGSHDTYLNKLTPSERERVIKVKEAKGNSPYQKRPKTKGPQTGATLNSYDS
ncbi:Uncharacterised protein [Escherichia coli]|nr:Uncharacterised protein [Escherichia coli]STH12463.1 Uncharacterised protein [Escherichia coli]STL45128.1 Uncharacterised protein [Escherichia coli]